MIVAATHYLPTLDGIGGDMQAFLLPFRSLSKNRKAPFLRHRTGAHRTRVAWRMEIEVYTSEFCAHGEQAERLLDQHGFTFKERKLAEFPEFCQQLREETGSVVAPQIVVGSRRIGGYDDLSFWLRSLQLEAV